MLSLHGACRPPFAAAGRGRGRAVGDPARGDRFGRSCRVDRGLGGDRRDRRRGGGDSPRRVLRLPALPAGALMRSGIFATPRPAPGRLWPAAGGGLVLLLALAVFLLAGWRLSGWALGAVLWVGMEALNLLLARLRQSTGNLAAAGVHAFGLFFKAVGLLVVLI